MTDVFQPDPEYDVRSVYELLAALHQGGSHARARTLRALALKCGSDEALIPHVVAAIRLPMNLSDRIFAVAVAS